MNYLPHLKTMKITWWRITQLWLGGSGLCRLCAHSASLLRPVTVCVWNVFSYSGWSRACSLLTAALSSAALTTISGPRHRHHSGWFCRTVTPNLQVIVCTTLPFSWEPFCASQSIHINSGCSLEPSPHCCHLIYTTWRRLEMKYISTVSAQ